MEKVLAKSSGLAHQLAKHLPRLCKRVEDAKSGTSVATIDPVQLFDAFAKTGDAMLSRLELVGKLSKEGVQEWEVEALLQVMDFDNDDSIGRVEWFSAWACVAQKEGQARRSREKGEAKMKSATDQDCESHAPGLTTDVPEEETLCELQLTLCELRLKLERLESSPRCGLPQALSPRRQKKQRNAHCARNRNYHYVSGC